MLTDAPAPAWVPLSSRERRVLGVMVEKQKTTPDGYPMTIAAITTACNQKSNRDPVVAYDPDDVEDVLQDLRKKGAAVLLEGSGRVVKWKHSLYEWLGLRNRPVEMAVMAELMLRGRQTEGDLRGRASRMESILDLDALQGVLKTLQDLNLVIYLTPPEVRRGAVLTHNLYTPTELAQVRAEFARSPQATEEPRASRSAEPASDLRNEVGSLRAEMDELKAEVARMASELRDLTTSLGA